MNKVSFILFNLLISSNLLFGFLLLTFLYVFLVFYSLINGLEPFGLAIWISLFFVFFVWIFKILIFIILSQIKHKDTYMTQFFERIKNERKYKFKVVLYALLSDFLCIFLTPIMETFIFNIFPDNSSTYRDFFFSNIVSFFLWGGGVTLSYLSLIIWFKIRKHKINCKNV